ncbi:non-ribosomal peptide synthetase [Tahibacter amnicola]|uniref:Amino acid adenylation domain-containing protein n=1 Tax=Tahibacter amnicola TaxID=2976241 RepID=A0ABY6BAP5_9GAMM|nr:non-ribosomal peptide synthetase [Tahibacter amnicola]UXI66223.1 amino acid adenylation domain-containing protein [Tahibacter amnicola]
MSIELLKEASSLGVSLFLSNGKLKVRANQGALTDDLRRRILDAKAEITALLETVGGIRAEDGSESIKPALRRGERLPLSFQQQRLWVLSELQPGSTDYNMPFAFRIRGGFSLERAQSAIDNVVARHEVLRTSFHRDDEGIYQRGHSQVRVPIIRRDLHDVAHADQDAAVQRFIAEDAAVPFDLARPPLIRAAWMALSPDEGVLYFNLHHIVFDGWSVDILLREFVAFYTAPARMHSDAAMPLSIQYADYAVWQRERLNAERLGEQVGYWTRVLQGAPAVHPLPLDFERPKVKRHAGDVVQGVVAPAHLARLQTLAQALDVTLFMVLHGALSVVLARYGADSDVIVGTPVANRHNSQLDELIGFFINTLVLRVSCDETQTVRDFYRQVREVNLGAQTHQDVPFEMLIDRLNVPRSTAHSPLFQVMLSLDNTVRSATSNGAFEVQPVNVGVSQAKYDLTLNASAGPDGLALSWIYDTSLFRAETIRRLDEHLGVLLLDLAGDVDRPLSALDSLAIPERAFLTHDLVGETVAIDADCLPDRQLAATARRTPDAVAVADGRAVIRYAELDQQVDHLAGVLYANGVARQDRVGIVLPPSPAMVVAVLACLRVGAVYVPMDPASAAKKIDHIVADSAIKLLLTVSTLPDFTRNTAVKACYLDEALDRGDWRSASPVSPPELAADDLAYILYTSGSTGQPKGVAITRSGLCNYLGHCLREYAREPFDEAVMSSPLTFDATITTLFTPFLCGKTLRIVSAGQEALAQDLGELMLGDAARRLYKLTPAHLDLLVRYWREQGEARRGQAPVLVVIGGEQLLKKTLEPFLERMAAGSAFVNEYGPTETVVGCCVYTVRSKADLAGDSAVVPIGRPIQNTQLHLFHGHRLSPLGATGELFIAGAGVARGYLNQPALQERHFVLREVGGVQRPYYRTGDQVRYGDNGQLVFVGRNDEQIKLRGYRIEPAEIEACLCACTDVREACVLLSDQLATPALVAYVVATDAADREDALAAQLRDWCKAGLPAPYVPSAFKFVDQLPTTANGKVDKRALAALPLNIQPAASYAAPETPMQQALSDLFAGLLKRERVGINDNFFALGGDSILAIQAVSRAKKAGLRITTQQIFEHQTIAELSKVAIALGARTVGVETGDEPFELTPIQHWFVRSQPHALHHYNQSLILEAPADIDAGTLARIAEALLRRHDALRSKFVQRDGVWKAVGQPFDSALLSRCLAEESLPDGVDESRRFIASRCNHYQAGLNLETGPLFKVVLFKGMRGARVLILAHHMVVDGVSWRVLLDDFERAYRQLSTGDAIALGAKGTSYQYWSGLLGRHASRIANGQERAYWATQLSAGNFPFREFEPAELPTVATSRQVSQELSTDETAALLTHANASYGTRTLDLLLAAVFLGLAPWAKSDAFAVELEGHGREALEADLDLSETLGWFTCLYPHVLRGAPGDPGATLRTIKEDLRAIPGGGIGFGLLKYLAAEPQLQAEEHAPHIVFNYLGQLDQGGSGPSAFTLANEDGGAQVAPQARRAHRLAITAFTMGGRLRLSLDYSHAEYSEETAAAMLQAMVSAAQAVIAHCTRQQSRVFTPSDFPLTTIRTDALDRLQAAEAIADLYPSTPMQRGMLAVSELDRSAYVTQFYPMLRGTLEPTTLARAWQGVVDKYASLRTRFVVEDDVQYQLVRRNVDGAMAVVDLSDGSEAEQQARFQALCEQDKAQGFAGTEPALYRITLVRFGADLHRLLFTCHHSVFDGWSMSLVFNQLLHNVKRLGKGEALVVAAEADYDRYVAWLLQQDAEQAIAAWRDYLARPTPRHAEAAASERAGRADTWPCAGTDWCDRYPGHPRVRAPPGRDTEHAGAVRVGTGAQGLLR